MAKLATSTISSVSQGCTKIEIMCEYFAKLKSIETYKILG